MLADGLLKRWGVDRAVFYAVAARAWQFPAGLATTVLIAFCFTPAVQGYYYTFSTLLGLQSLVDLGLQWVLLHFVSHEWARLNVNGQGAVVGDEHALGRLAAITHRARRWFLGTTLCYLVGVGLLGAWLFERRPAEAPWQWPWAVAVLIAGGSLLLSPRLAILEGCNQVLRVNQIRLWQAVTASFCVWFAMVSGWNLWTIVIAFAVQLLWEAWLVLFRYRPFWRSLTSHAHRPLDWRAEIWPLQWRIGVQSVLRYLAFQLFTPVMFEFHGAEVAGRMGMSLAILTNIQLAAFAPVRTRAPQLGMLIAQRDYASLDRQFLRLTLLSVSAYIAAFGGFTLLVMAFNTVGGAWPARLAARFLPLSDIVLLGSGLLMLHIGQCLAVYIRAHKQDPLLKVLVTSNLSISVLVLLLGASSGPRAAAASFAVVATCFTLPAVSWVWWTTRRAWHADGAATALGSNP